MTDFLRGKKFSDKDVIKLMTRLEGHLEADEEVVLAVSAIVRHQGDSIIVTNKRVIATYKWKPNSNELEVSIPLKTITRIAFEGRKFLVKTDQEEVLSLGSLDHQKDDEPLVRRILAQLISEGSNGINDAPVVIDQLADLRIGPRTKESRARDGVTKVDTFLSDGEKLLYVETNVNDYYFLTSKQLLLISGTFKTKCSFLDMTEILRVEVIQAGTNWRVIGADANHEFTAIADFSHQDSAEWFRDACEITYPQMKDSWRDDIRKVLQDINLGYAFESVFPVMSPRFQEEEILAAFGSIEDFLIFTTERVIVLPDCISIARDDWTQLEFSSGRHDYFSHTGSLTRAEHGMSVAGRVADGRRFTRVMGLGDSEQEFNAAIPGVLSMLRTLSQTGYPVSEGPDWYESTTSPPPVVQQSQGSSSWSGFEVEF